MRNNTKIKKSFNYLFRFAILLLTWGFIYREIFYTKDWRTALFVFNELTANKESVLPLVIIVFMMFVNWGIESYKWRFLIRKIERVSFIKSFEAVLTGISVTTFTPNRTGEYLGRVFILEKASRIEGSLITFLGSLSQLLVTILAGTLSLILYIPLINQSPFFSGYIYYGLLTLVAAFGISLLLVYFNISILFSLREKFLRSKLRKFRKFFRVFSCFSFRELLFTIFLSLLRYAVFSIQFWVLLKMFSVPIPLSDALVLVSLVFFLVTVFPTIALTELGIRGTVSIYLFGLYFTHKGLDPENYNVGVVAASTLLWIINLAVPAIAGTFFVYRLKFFRKNNGEAYSAKK